MTPVQSVLADLIRHGHDPLWRASALCALQQKRREHMQEPNAVAVVYAQAVIDLVKTWHEDVAEWKREIMQDLAGEMCPIHGIPHTGPECGARED